MVLHVGLKPQIFGAPGTAAAAVVLAPGRRESIKQLKTEGIIEYPSAY